LSQESDLGRQVDLQLHAVLPGDEQGLDRVADLHMELLDFGPMAGLGRRFIRNVAYAIQVRDGLLHLLLCEVDGRPAGFVAYTNRSITFHRESLRKHFVFVAWAVLRSLMADPRRVAALVRSIGVTLTRRAEEQARDPLGEIVCVAAVPEFLKPRFVRQTGLRVSDLLITHAAAALRRSGAREMRMLVDADNKAPLFLYHRLGARIEPSDDLGGVPTVEVWFDLGEFPPDFEEPIPDTWALAEPGTLPRQNRFGTWSEHWDVLPDAFAMFQEEARDTVHRLEASGLMESVHRLLDFGCGFGYLADALAPRIGELWLWDASVNMRTRSRIRAGIHPNVRFLDLSDPGSLPAADFDLVLVNSVIQYMGPDEVENWLARWCVMLAAEGRLVLSDVPASESGPLQEIADSLTFAWRHGFLIRSLFHAAREFGRYVKIRRSSPLLEIEEPDLRAMAERQGLSLERLDTNLTYREARRSFVLQRRETPIARALGA